MDQQHEFAHYQQTIEQPIPLNNNLKLIGTMNFKIVGNSPAPTNTPSFQERLERGDVMALFSQHSLAKGTGKTKDLIKWYSRLYTRLIMDSRYLTKMQDDMIHKILDAERYQQDSNPSTDDVLEISHIREQMMREAQDWAWDLVQKDACTGIEWREMLSTQEQAKPMDSPKPGALRQYRLGFLRGLSNHRLK